MTEAWGPGGDGPRRPAGPVRVRVPAKINLHLGVGTLRPDGFHELATVYHAISLFDELPASAGDTLTLTMEGEGAGELALDDSNLVVRAARALAAHTRVPAHARLHLRKSIPIEAGLAGGSADAAATLLACDVLWGTGLTRDELAEVGAEVGSDIPFLLYGGTALGTGRGETISPILARPTTWHWVLAVADGGLATPEVYRELDRLRDEQLGADAGGRAGRADDRAAPARPRGAGRGARQRPATGRAVAAAAPGRCAQGRVRRRRGGRNRLRLRADVRLPGHRRRARRAAGGVPDRCRGVPRRPYGPGSHARSPGNLGGSWPTSSIWTG